MNPEDVEHITWPATTRHAWRRNINRDDFTPPPRHRADIPYDVENDGWDDGLEQLSGPAVIFAAFVLLAVAAGLVTAVIAFVGGSPLAWWGAGLLLAAGTAGMWILWDGGER